MVRLKGLESFYKVDGSTGGIWSNGGRHGANHNGRYLKASKDKDGYNKVSLRDGNGRSITMRVGVAILSSYIDKPFDGAQVNHKNGDRSDDRLCNLEWVTASENIKHSFDRLGKNQKCSNNNFFKPWGFEFKSERFHFIDKSVDAWCRENEIASTTVYHSMKLKKELSKGRFKGYRFYRIKEEFEGTGE